ELAAGAVPRSAGGGLGDADEEQGEPAEDDVGADTLFEPVIDGPQVDDLLHVSPAALDFEELLVSGGDVSSRQVRVRAAEPVLTVEGHLGIDLGVVGAEIADGCCPEETVEDA